MWCLVTNANFEVLDKNLGPIPGLCAAGNVPDNFTVVRLIYWNLAASQLAVALPEAV
ncbi:MAG: hypothetical protein IKE43_08005 [Coriobacteriales bacterium]|nr:hypothetical protein [Coriobacteriales bacterium]